MRWESGKTADQSPVNSSLSEVSVLQWVSEIADWASSSPIEAGRDEGRVRWGRGQVRGGGRVYFVYGRQPHEGRPILIGSLKPRVAWGQPNSRKR